MAPSRHTFEEAVTLITEHAYDDAAPIEELLPRLAWKAFAFGLDIRLSGPGMERPTSSAMIELEEDLEHFHETFVAIECQEALAEAARNGNVTKLAAAIQLHVARYLGHQAITTEDVEAHRMEHAVGLTSYCLCSSLRLVDADAELAEVYWHEVSTARGDCTHSG